MWKLDITTKDEQGNTEKVSRDFYTQRWVAVFIGFIYRLVHSRGFKRAGLDLIVEVSECRLKDLITEYVQKNG